MKNFPFIHNGREYWYSRSVVCSSYVYAKCKGVWFVLAAKRSELSTSPLHWNVPGGFLDHDENAEVCATREIFEETGVSVPRYGEHGPILYKVDTDPRGKLQHVVMSFYVNLGEVDQLPALTYKYNDGVEVADIRWISMDYLSCYHPWLQGHANNIRKIYNEIINPSWGYRIRKFFNNL